MEQIFGIKLNAKQMALYRVEKMLQENNNRIKITGKKEAYAINIMFSVCEELGLNIK
jgi:hypothetical protein